MGKKPSDRLRTIWTSEMDRHFIDLMLDQVENGNKIDDRLFSKRAWKQMTTLFNTKFKFHYEKDILKNRHKTLRTLYKTINELLAINGFSWDQTRQMVTADNKVWDDYIMVHPSARSYRIKTIPYYRDLCQIYKDTSTEADLNTSDKNTTKSSSESSDNNVLPNPNTDLVEFREITNEGEDNRVRTYWQPPMDRYFIDLMVDQVDKGNQIDGLFNKQAWIDMINSFNDRFGFKYDVDILKNRYKTFKRQYNVVEKVLEARGFLWDDLRQMVVADDCIWQDYIEANSDARQYMTKSLPYYKDLLIIFKDSNTNEQGSISDTRSNKKHQSNEKIVFKRHLENNASSENMKKAKTDEESMLNVVREMASAVSCLVEKKKVEENKNTIDVKHVIEGVQSLADMDDDLILDACDYLEDDKKAKTFLALDVKLRRKWLIRKLRS